MYKLTDFSFRIHGDAGPIEGTQWASLSLQVDKGLDSFGSVCLQYLVSNDLKAPLIELHKQSLDDVIAMLELVADALKEKTLSEIANLTATNKAYHKASHQADQNAQTDARMRAAILSSKAPKKSEHK